VPKFEKALKGQARFLFFSTLHGVPSHEGFYPFTRNAPLTAPCLLKGDGSIDYYPTVLLFENGKVTKRLDAEPHEG